MKIRIITDEIRWKRKAEKEGEEEQERKRASGIERERAAGVEQLGSERHERGKREREATAKPGAGRNVVSFGGEKRRERLGWNTKYSHSRMISC